MVRISLSSTSLIVTSTSGHTISSIPYAKIQTVDYDEQKSGLFRIFVQNLKIASTTGSPVEDYQGYLVFKAVDSSACGDFVKHIVSSKLRERLTDYS